MKKRIIAALIILLSAGSWAEAQAQGKQLNTTDIFTKSLFRSSYVSGVRSMNDGQYYTSLRYNESGPVINKYSYSSAKFKKKIVGAQDLMVGDKQLEIETYAFSADEQKILIGVDREKIYRHSSKSNYYIYDLGTKKVKPLTDFNKGKQSLADFSPDGSKVAFVRENNLFVTDITSGEERQITDDGRWNFIINGALDWVYEEEFGFEKGFYWSPGSSQIAFYKTDEERVKEFQLEYYDKLYPTEYKFKYPKAGEDNSIVSIHVHDIPTNSTRKCDVGDETDQYIPRIKWTANDDQLCIMRLNRAQNKLEFLKVKTSAPPQQGLASEVFYTEESDTYVEVNDNLIFLENGAQFLWNSEQDGYNHIYLFDMNGKLVKQITKGEWDVISFKGYDKKTKKVFYTSSEDSPMDRQLYTVKIDGTGKKKLSTREGHNNAIFSKTYKYYLNYNSNANSPYHITVHQASGKLLRTLEDNNELIELLKEYNLPKKEFFSFKTSEGVQLNGWMIKPPDFDENKQYPLFMTCYNGPGLSIVNNSWGGNRLLWHSMLAQQGFVVACVDGRGTGARGVEFKKCTYKQLGKYETIDQIEAAKYLGSQKYIDAKRIGMQGWSYGGYMASLCITKGADVFKAAIAVAPVTSWRYYDSIYTERYMLTPQENASGYDDNSPINHVEKLKGDYLLIHGSADDNVHHQNTMEMISALVKANKHFDLFIYPDKNHRISGGNTQEHIYTKMTNFLKEKL